MRELENMDGAIIQVIVNLVNNAVEHTPAGTLITVRAVQEGKQAVISISDNGQGILDELKERALTARSEISFYIQWESSYRSF